MTNPDQPKQSDPATMDQAQQDLLQENLRKAEALAKKGGEPTPPASGPDAPKPPEPNLVATKTEKEKIEEVKQLRDELQKKEGALQTVEQAIAGGANRSKRKERLTQEIEDLKQKIEKIETGAVLPIDQRTVNTKVDTPAMIDTQTIPVPDTVAGVFGGGEMSELDKFNKESIEIEKKKADEAKIPVAQVAPPLSKGELFQVKKDELELLNKKIEFMQDVGVSEELLEKREKVFAEIEELTGEDLKRRVQVEAKKMLGKKEMNPQKFKEREMPKIAKEIRGEQEARAKEFCRKEHGFAPNDPDFDLYFQKKLQASGLDPDEFYGMVCRGVRVDRLKEKVAFWKTVKNLVTGNESIAHKYEIPRDGKETLYLSEDDLEAFLAVQKNEQGREDELEKEKKFAERLQKGKAKLAETRAKVAQEILDKAEVKYYVNGKEEHPLLARKLDYAEQRIVLPSVSEEKTGEQKDKVKSPEQPIQEPIKGPEGLPINSEKALMEHRVFIDEMIRNNPNASRDEFFEVPAGESAADYGLSKEQTAELEKQVDLYIEKREKFKIFWERYKDDKITLINILTGQTLDEDQVKRVDVQPIPTGVIIETDEKILDLLHRKYGKKPKKISGGFASRSLDKANKENNDIDYVIVESYDAVVDRETKKRKNENKKPLSEKQLKQLKEDVENIKLHELEHVDYYRKNTSKRERLQQDRVKKLGEYNTEKDVEIKKNKLEEYLKTIQKQLLDSVKNEILASLFDQKLKGLQKKLENYFLSGEDSRYDYLEKKGIRASKVYREAEKLHPAMVEKIFVKEYGDYIKDAANALSYLMIKLKYSPGDVRDCLTDSDLEFWPKEVNELKEESKKEKSKKNNGVKSEKKAEKKEVVSFESIREFLNMNKNSSVKEVAAELFMQWDNLPQDKDRAKKIEEIVDSIEIAGVILSSGKDLEKGLAKLKNKK